MAIERLVGLAHFAKRCKFGPNKFQSPLHLLVFKGRVEVVSRVGAYFYHSCPSDLALGFDFDFVDLLDVDVDEGLGGQHCTVDMAPFGTIFLVDVALI